MKSTTHIYVISIIAKLQFQSNQSTEAKQIITKKCSVRNVESHKEVDFKLTLKRLKFAEYKIFWLSKYYDINYAHLVYINDERIAEHIYIFCPACITA